MSSTSTTWTTDTNTKSGTVQIYESNVSVLRITGIEDGNAILDLFADQGDDNADKWRMWVNASDDDLHFSNYTSGAWGDILTLQDGGNVGIGTAVPDATLHIANDTNSTTFKPYDQMLLTNAGGLADASTDARYAGTGYRVGSISGSGDSDRIKGWFGYVRTAAKGRGDFVWVNDSADDVGNCEIGQEVMRLNNGGQLGIGTSSPGAKLDISATNTTGYGLKVERDLASGSTNAQLVYFNNTNTGDDQDCLYVNNDGGGACAHFSNDGSVIMQVGASGGKNVGIGTPTPSTALHVVKDDTTNTGVTTLLTLGHSVSNTADDNIGGEILFLNEASDGNMKNTAAMQAIMTNADEGDSTYDGALQFRTINAKSWVDAMRILHDGKVGIGDDSPDANLCIQQGAGDGKALTFKSSDISHGFTSYSVGGVNMEADTYGVMLKGSATNGGLEIHGTSEYNYRALILQGNIDGTPDNTHTASGYGAVEIRGTVEDSGDAGTIGSGKNILSIAKGLSGVTVFIVDADGNYWFDGAAQTAFDSYDDAHLIRAFDTYSSPNDIIQTKFDDFLKYKKSTLEDSGIIYKLTQEEEDEGQKPFICGTKLQKLHNGAIWQQYTELEKMKELMYETMVELLGKEKADKKLDSHNIKLLDEDLLN